MLTQEERIRLKAEVDEAMKQFGVVSEEDMNQYPASVKETAIPTSRGDAKVYVIVAGPVSDSRPLFLNFHGGGFIGKRLDRDELFCRKIANQFSGIVLDVDYKLAPEHPYPAAVEECIDVAVWAWENRDDLKYDPSRIVLMGHSSGGNLVAGICMKLGQTGLFRPACALMDYSPLDLATDPAEKERSICDMPADRARNYNTKYIQPEQAKEPYASPIYAEPELLEHFPDTLIISAGEDSLCMEDEEFALRLIRAGVTVTARRFTRSVHGFVVNRMCEWEDAMELITRFVSEHI